MLASAWRRVGEPERAVKVLDARPAGVAEDPEAAFLLGTEYLWLKQSASAERLFAQALAARPLPQLHVLIGRAYRDAGKRAGAPIARGPPRTPASRLHYYLGMTALADGAGGPDRLDMAIAEFRAELALVPTDPLSSDQLRWPSSTAAARRYARSIAAKDAVLASPPERTIALDQPASPQPRSVVL